MPYLIFFYDVAVDMQVWSLLTRSQCRVSDTQVTVKACGPLVLHCTVLKNGSPLFWIPASHSLVYCSNISNISLDNLIRGKLFWYENLKLKSLSPWWEFVVLGDMCCRNISLWVDSFNLTSTLQSTPLLSTPFIPSE